MSELTGKLSRAGVGRRYYEARLSQMEKPGTDLLAWVDNEMDADLKKGAGVNIYGKGARATALTQALTRLFVLMGVRCRLVPLLTLLDEIRDDEAPEFETLLIVSHFYSAGYRSPPLMVREQMTIEGYLRDRLGRDLCTFISAGAPPDQWGGWWSSELVAELVSANHPVKDDG